ncbi:MAG: DUF3352 domain-containing protein [Microcoleaceae cyanobacterium]
MPRKYWSGGLIVAVAIAGLSSLVVFTYWQQVRVRAYSLSNSAQLVPQEAIAATFIAPHPTALGYLEDFSTPESRALLGQALTPLIEQGLAGTTLSYDRDLRPWIGGILVAVLPAKTTTAQPNLVMVIGIKDRLKAWGFARSLNRQTDLKRQESQYQGVKITQYQEPDGKQYYLTMLRDHIVVGAHRQAITQVIDSVQSGISLATPREMSEQFLDSAGVPNPLATVYIANYPQFIQVMAKDAQKSAQPSVRILAQFKPVRSVVFGVGVDSEGMRLKLVTRLAPAQSTQNQPEVSTVELGKILDRLPTETIALMNTQGVNQIWSQISTWAPEDSQPQRWVDQVRQALQTINLDADQDVFGWMDGEFALGAVPSEEGILAPLGLGGVLVLETSDRPQAEAMFAKLDTIIAQSNPPVNVEQRTLRGVEVTEWKDPRQGTLFGHGWLDENLVFLAFGGPVVEAMTTPPQRLLQDNPRFQTIRQSLPHPDYSYIYIDMEHLLAWATGYLLAAPATALQPDALTLLNAIQGIGLSATRPTQTQAEVEMFLELKPQPK